jgi:hypothetical protein
MEEDTMTDAPDFIPDRPGQTEPSPDFIPDESPDSLPEQLGTAAEHAASSATFGLSTAAETGLGISTPEAIQARTEKYPGSAVAGDIAGLLVPGAPEAQALEAAGKLGAGLVRGSGALSRIGKVAVKGAIENAMYQTGDEVSKKFSEDPNQSAETATSAIGMSALLGGAIGGVGFGLLPELSDKLGVTKFAGDFADRIKEHLTNPDIKTEGADNLAKFFDDIQKGSDSLFKGGFDEAGNPLSSVKDQAVDKLIPQINPKMMDSAIGDTVNKLQDTVDKMTSDKETFQGRYSKMLNKQLDDWKAVTDNPDVSSQQIFHATEQMKRNLDGESAWGEYIPKTDPSYPAIQEIRKTANFLRDGLQNESIWGEAGKFQKETNKAYSQFLAPLKDFNSSFGAKVEGQYKVDPDKVQTYINQVDKEKGTIRGEKLQNYIDAADKYRNAINTAHEGIGIAGPFSPEAKEGLQGLSTKLDPGAKAADALVKQLVEKSGGNAAGIVGGVVGGWPGYIAGKVVGGPIMDSVTSTLLKPMLGTAVDGTGFRAALDYLGAYSKGEAALNKGVSNIFKAGKEVLGSSLQPSEKDTKKLDEHLKSLAENPEPMINVGGKVSHYLPEHGSALAQTSMNAVNYLNSVRPSAPKVSPLDSPQRIDPMQKQEWIRTLGIAEQPLTVLQHIKSGTLQPNDIKTLNTLYPSLYQKISGQLVTEISRRTDKSDPIPYRTKMGMSLFLNQPMDSTMQPESIIAAQPVPAQPQRESGKKPTAQSAKSADKVSASYMTPQQLRQAQHSGSAKA